VKKADEKKPHKPLTTESPAHFENNKAFTGFASCPTCFNFLKIPLTSHIGARQTKEPKS
jgi:hypothetical protein